MNEQRKKKTRKKGFKKKKILFIYLTKRDTAREGTQTGEVGEREAGFPPSREPAVGLDSRTLGS